MGWWKCDHVVVHCCEGDRVFRSRADRINGARVKNAITEEIRSQAFISGLLIEQAIAFTLRM
jgi:hypothetical protein